SGWPSAMSLLSLTEWASPSGRQPSLSDTSAGTCCPHSVNPPSPSSISPDLSDRLAVAATSELKQIDVPVGSLRSAAEATEIPSSSPIMCVGRYIVAYLPLWSCRQLYSTKHCAA